MPTSSNNDPASRKPSGSSVHSGMHSSAGSPNHAQTLRNLGGSPNFFGVGMGTVKSANSGWQVWGNSTPSSRNPSASSATSMPSESAASKSGGGFRSARDESWNTPRSASATWEETRLGSARQDIPSMDQPLGLQHTRHRQAGLQTGLGTPAAGFMKGGQFGTQRFASSPTRLGHYDTGVSPFSGQLPLQPGAIANIDPRQTNTTIDHDLSAGIRGMAVSEDEYAISQSNQESRSSAVHFPTPNPTQPTQPPSNVRSLPPAQQSQTAFNGFPQPDYSGYYAYPYGAPPDAALFMHSPAMSAANPVANVYSNMPLLQTPDMHAGQQPGVFYDYNPMRAAGPQYYHLSPPLMYHPPQPRPAATGIPGQPTTMNGNRDLQYNMPQPQNNIYGGGRVPSSPHLQFPSLDYAPSMQPGISMYGQAGIHRPSAHGHGQGHHGYRARRHRQHEENAAPRSAMLEEFRSNRTRTWELKDVFGFVAEFSRDQHGSRFIQQQLEIATPEERQRVFEELVPNHTGQLVQDVFGNYVIQKLFEYGTPAQHAQLVSAMEGRVLGLSMDMYGCRVVQKAVEFLQPEQQSAFVNELDGNVLKLVHDANGNHVIQKMVQVIAPERLTFVKAFRGNVLGLATHPFGCRVLQRSLERLPIEHTRPLLDELLEHSLQLMQDQFGNYVVQYVLEHGQPQDNAAIVSSLRGQFLLMARHKFASNVCEKALITTTSELRRALIDEIISPKHEGANVIMMMMKDQYANYVLQRALGVVEGDQKVQLVNKVRPQLLQMRRHTGTFSKHLLAIDRLLEKCAVPAENTTSPPEKASAESAESTSS
ncbi:ARM repeat-containing protein [Panus rudis PR-1116 ss-1]|nr:ARM repeat-containing protein [Panus rudis PR-1116 ss-1]